MGAERIGWAHAKRGAPQARDGPWRRGWGMASQIWGGGGGPPAKALVKLLPDGTAEVAVGVQDLGTGTKTVLAQVAAEELGLPLEAVRVVVGDTLATPFGPGSGGSVTLASTTPAVRGAARDALQPALWAGRLYARPARRVTADEFQRARAARSSIGHDPTRRAALPRGGGQDGQLYDRGPAAPAAPTPMARRSTPLARSLPRCEVNIETGQVRVDRVVAVHEIGRVVNPLTADEPGVRRDHHGAGLWRSWRSASSTPRTGLQLTANLEDYRIAHHRPTCPRSRSLFVDEADPGGQQRGQQGLGRAADHPAGRRAGQRRGRCHRRAGDRPAAHARSHPGSACALEKEAAK